MLKFIRYFIPMFVLVTGTKSFAQNTGINTKDPGSTLTVNGSFAANYKIISTGTTLGITDYYTAYNGNSDGSITLPAAISGPGNFKGRIYYIKNTSNSKLTIYAHGAEKINGISEESSVILKPGYYMKLISKGTMSGSTWDFFMLSSKNRINTMQINGIYSIPQGSEVPHTSKFFVKGNEFTIAKNTETLFMLPISEPIFLNYAIGLDDLTAYDATKKPYFRCELFIDGEATGLFQIVKQSASGTQLQFNISGIVNLSEGMHEIDARIIRWYNSGFVSSPNGYQVFGVLSSVFDAYFIRR